MIDKSNDYLYQNSTITIWYLAKTTEGDATFNTNSVTVFKAATGIVQIAYVVRNMPSREGELQIDRASFNIWRIPAGSVVPALGDKLYDGEGFWIVDHVDYCDRDDLLSYNRYRVTCKRSKQKVVA